MSHRDTRSVPSARITEALLPLAALAFGAGSASAAGGDECYSREQITGTGLYGFTSVGMTLSPQPIPTDCLPAGAVKRDVWYEWTVPADGDYKITTTGHTAVNTKLVVYDGLWFDQWGCHGSYDPLACNDIDPHHLPCYLTSKVYLCGLLADEVYVIRLGTPDYSGWGNMEIKLIGCGGSGGGGGGGGGASGNGASQPWTGITGYCSALPNSLGHAPVITGTGSGSLTMNDLGLSAAPLPPSQFSVFYMGDGQVEVPFGDGVRCVGPGPLGLLVRFPVQQVSNCGQVDLSIPLENMGIPMTPGFQLNFQAWYRDPGGPGGSGFNLTNALAVTFTP